MSSYCSRTGEWQNSNFQSSWFSYTGTPYGDGQYPAARASSRFVPPPAKVLGSCTYKGASGKCVKMSECGTTSFSSAQGAKGCEKFAWDVKCCVFSCNQ